MRPESRGLIAARQKGVRTPPQTPKKKACGGCTPSHTGVQTPARPPPHAARRPHAYKWREDGWLGVPLRRTGVLAMHACLEGVQALHALRTWYPYKGTKWYPYKGTEWYPYKGTERYPCEPGSLM
ncbi:hypothetical protein PCASD_19780 [Puccinia coronata f. sp. avenae]|uniref:Uncharacterized protein n=1 Tax=Puccinia coronata f. sp. avenae TaxID=200324 RepID=A0A2N5TXN2_9BASI|nr:hypothetical protein PCASD_19780 [Puccinia coronata f. sp. avenae]